MPKQWNKNLTISEILDRLRYLQSAVECGIHSGFPPCCVQFFVTEKMWMQDGRRRDYSAQMAKREIELGKSWGYIPCPACLIAGNMVEILPCPNGITCHPEESRAYGYTSAFPRNILDSINETYKGFQAIKSGIVPIAGSVSALVSKNLDKLKEFTDERLGLPTSNRIDI